MKNNEWMTELSHVISCDADISYLEGEEKEAQFYLG